MIGDADRGLNYDSPWRWRHRNAIAFVERKRGEPPGRGQMVCIDWAARRFDSSRASPGPLEEVQANNLNFHVPSEIEVIGRGSPPGARARTSADPYLRPAPSCGRVHGG